MVTDLSILKILGPTEPPSHTERAGEKSPAWEGAAIVNAKSAEADKERNVARYFMDRSQIKKGENTCLCPSSRSAHLDKDAVPVSSVSRSVPPAWLLVRANPMEERDNMFHFGTGFVQRPKMVEKHAK